MSQGNQFEGPPITKNERSSRRLMLAVNTHLMAILGKVDLVDKENLGKIPKGRKVIFAPTHLTDADVVAAISKLGDSFDLAIADISTHHDASKDLSGAIGIGVAGKENFIPIDFVRTEDNMPQAQMLNPDNFRPMVEALERGKAVVLAAHNPSANGRLSPGGIGAVYLAQLTGAVIVPIAVNTKTDVPYLSRKTTFESMKTKPDADVIIGEPIELPPIDNVEAIAQVLAKRKAGLQVGKDELSAFHTVSKFLKEQSGGVMNALASMLPVEKRGPFAGVNP